MASGEAISLETTTPAATRKSRQRTFRNRVGADIRFGFVNPTRNVLLESTGGRQRDLLCRLIIGSLPIHPRTHRGVGRECGVRCRCDRKGLHYLSNGNRIDAPTFAGDSDHTVLLLDHIRPLPPVSTDCGGRSYGVIMIIHVALEFSSAQCPDVDSYRSIVPGKYCP